MNNLNKQLIEDVLFIMYAAFIAFNLFFLVLGGEITIREPRLWIRIPEFIFALAVFGFAIYQWVNHILRRRRYRE